MKSIGLREDLMFRSVHAGDKLAHYARACTDVTFKFPFGTQVIFTVKLTAFLKKHIVLQLFLFEERS